MLDKFGKYFKEIDYKETTPIRDFNLTKEEERALQNYFSENLPGRVIPENLIPAEINKLSDEVDEVLAKKFLEDSFLTFGNIPKYAQDSAGKKKWFSELGDFAMDVTLDERFYYPEGPVISHAAEISGYFSIGIHEDNKANESILKEIYDSLSHNAVKVGISDLPVLFRYETLPELVSTGYNTRWRPMPGSVRVESLWGGATSNLAMRNNSTAANCYVITGHMGSNKSLIGIGQKIYQNYQPTTSNEAGTVDRHASNNTADAVRVNFTEVLRGVHIGSGSVIPIHDHSDPAIGIIVYKSGITSAVTSGKVTKVGLSNQVSSSYGALSKQAAADFTGSEGDSGAPVYSRDWIIGSGYYNTYYGLYWGNNANGSLFSINSCIRSELGVTPLLTAF
ncbi:MAG: hypothetical protein KGZ63_00160 [Clostridiales bacterium]|nr:hypothetical protein [Clostridiales bacterium]